ncbi:uncharacterized protein LOC132927298 [Rhopalosiphum padi]|uniref:uncharacterized protein LOC132927298 n=1 Tax=Rhopalosiphum padi TaxID=40932 RepID=UPI00298E6A9B|nr:uncharacterized protein LOC132927298 [Rhopalosiphum padi]
MVKQYNTMHEHNYFRDNKKKNCRWDDKKVNHTVKITNDHDDCNFTLDCYIEISSSDEEEDIKHMPLSRLLKIEVEKDLLKECKNKKSLEDQLYDELINENNQDNMLNISNKSNNIISENHPINNGEQSKTAQIVPLTNDSTIIKNQNITNVNKKARTDHYNINYQGVNFSLDTINPIVKKDNVNVTKTSANIVCPPLNWIHLIYLAIKNSATENVSCLDIQNFARYWFPFYRNNSYIGYIYIILSHIIDDFHEKYFYCNSFPINMNQHDTWTINSIYINTLEKSLIEFVENNEDKIKSAMTNPDNLSTIVNGYGVFYLGFSQNL